METYMPCNRTDNENAAAALIVLLTSTIGTTANGLVVLSYFVTSYLNNEPRNCLIMNKALLDFLSAIYVQLPCMANLYNPNWYFLETACIVHSIIMWSIMTASNWILASICLDRMISVLMPYKYQSIVTAFRIRCTVVFIWIYSVTLSGVLIDKDIVSRNNWELICSPKWTKKNDQHAYIAAVFCFILPITIQLSSFIVIPPAARRLHSISPSQNSAIASETNLNENMNNQIKTLPSFYVLVIIYVICGTPYFWGKFSFVTHKDGALPPSVLVFCMLIMFLTSALNPCLYTLFWKEYRLAFLKTWEIISAKKREICTEVQHAISCCKISDKANT